MADLLLVEMAHANRHPLQVRLWRHQPDTAQPPLFEWCVTLESDGAPHLRTEWTSREDVARTAFSALLGTLSQFKEG